MKKPAVPKTKKLKKQVFPPGWNEKKVQEVIAYYDSQTEDEELAEYEAAMKIGGRSVMFVPTELVPEIRRLIARRSGAQDNRPQVSEANRNSSRMKKSLSFRTQTGKQCKGPTT